MSLGWRSLPSHREGRIQAALACGSIILTLFALEGIARALRRGGGKEQGETLRYVGYDPLLGWAKEPNKRVTYKRREYTVEVSINSHGLRDLERGYDTPPGTERLLAVGDSFLEGYGVPMQENVTQVLEKALARDGCRAEVINGGTAAYSTDQELLFYRSEGVRYTPSVVVVFFYYNDIVYNDRQSYFGSPKPNFQMTRDGLQLHRYPVPRPAAADASKHSDDEEPSGSALLEWVGERLWYGAPQTYKLGARIGLWRPMNTVPIRLELRVYQRRLVPDVEQAWTKTIAVLSTFSREVTAKGGRFLVVGVPARFEVDDLSWELSKELYAMDDVDWDRGRVMARLTQIGADAGFPVLDLTEALRRANGTLRKPYYSYDGHWNALGHRIAAEQVRLFLREQRWLRCAVS
jgi:hypothetical protein